MLVDNEGDTTLSEKVLEVKNLTKCYNKRVAVDNISFEVFDGEIFGFLGPNGAGKSTTIKMITGLAKMTSGDVFICGKSIKKDFEGAIVNLGGIIENPEMYGYMTGLDNLKFFASLYGDVTDARIWEVATLVGMQNRLKDKVKSYSLGMKQRLGIAQALLHYPKILILDEPTNGLDPNGIQEMRAFLKKLARQENIAILISSHILAEMEQLCDIIAIIDKGRLVEIKTIKQLHSGLKVRYSIKVDYPNYAGKLIYNELGMETELAGTNVIIPCDEQLVPKITSLLISKNLSIFGITTVTKSLEEVFLDIVNAKGSFSTSIT